MEVQGLRLAASLWRGSDVRARAYREYMAGGPPFVEVDGVWLLNVGFELPRGGRSERRPGARGTMTFRRLTAAETKMLRDRRLDADLEVWAKLTA